MEPACAASLRSDGQYRSLRNFIHRKISELGHFTIQSGTISPKIRTAPQFRVQLQVRMARLSSIVAWGARLIPVTGHHLRLRDRGRPVSHRPGGPARIRSYRDGPSPQSAKFCGFWTSKTPADYGGRSGLSEVRAYFSGDSVFEPEPVGPVVVFGAGPSYGPFSLIPDHPVSLLWLFDMPVVPDFFTTSELVFVIPALSCWPAGPVVCA